MFKTKQELLNDLQDQVKVWRDRADKADREATKKAAETHLMHYRQELALVSRLSEEELVEQGFLKA